MSALSTMVISNKGKSAPRVDVRSAQPSGKKLWGNVDAGMDRVGLGCHAGRNFQGTADARD